MTPLFLSVVEVELTLSPGVASKSLYPSVSFFSKLNRILTLATSESIPLHRRAVTKHYSKLISIISRGGWWCEILRKQTSTQHRYHHRTARCATVFVFTGLLILTTSRDSFTFFQLFTGVRIFCFLIRTSIRGLTSILNWSVRYYFDFDFSLWNIEKYHWKPQVKSSAFFFVRLTLQPKYIQFSKI